MLIIRYESATLTLNIITPDFQIIIFFRTRLATSPRQRDSYARPDVAMKESGKYRGKTKISKKGNARIRQCLFMPALSASVYNKNIRALYESIVEKNPQIKRIGVVAAMRKLPVLIFVLWKKDEAYNENYRWGKAGYARPTSGNDEDGSLHSVKKAGHFMSRT
jgi:hypothetical protein